MSILYRCAVQRGSLCTIERSSRRLWSTPLYVHQPGLSRCYGFSWRPNLPLCHIVLGRRHFASRRIPSKPCKRPWRPPSPTKILKPPEPSEPADPLTDHLPIEVKLEWVGIAIIYAALTVITWVGTTFSWLRYSEETPVTGRRRFAYFSAPPYSDEPLAEKHFQELEKIQRRMGPLSEKARKVFKDIAVAAGVDDREWKVYIIPGLEANASVADDLSMVIIYYGMFRHLKCDDDLVVVLAHELGHVIANHGDERYSRFCLEYFYAIPYAPAGIVGAVSLCLSAVAGAEFIVGAFLLIPFGVGKSMRLSSYRKQEKEADSIGLLLMTEAGYNPYAGRRVWASMKAEEDREFAAAKALAKQMSPAVGLPRKVVKVPEHKQTHPLSESRMEDLARLAPQALAIVKGDIQYLQRARTPVNHVLLRGWADFKASRDGKLGGGHQALN